MVSLSGFFLFVWQTKLLEMSIIAVMVHDRINLCDIFILNSLFRLQKSILLMNCLIAISSDWSLV